MRPLPADHGGVLGLADAGGPNSLTACARPMARFIIADLTDPSCSPYEVAQVGDAFVPFSRSFSLETNWLPTSVSE